MLSPFIQAWRPSSRLSALGRHVHSVPTERLQHLLLSWTCPLGSLSACEKWKRPLQHGPGLCRGRKLAYHKHGAYGRAQNPSLSQGGVTGVCGTKLREAAGVFTPLFNHWCKPLSGPFQGRAPPAGDTAASLLHLQPPGRRQEKAEEQSAEMASSPPWTLPCCRERSLSWAHYTSPRVCLRASKWQSYSGQCCTLRLLLADPLVLKFKGKACIFNPNSSFWFWLTLQVRGLQALILF